jgi:arsenical pump membrane protein
MFVVVLALDKSGATQALASLLSRGNTLVTFGMSSFLFANLVNNIPMSVLFSEILAAGSAPLGAVYATVIGSNVGAFFTPIGALAGIMWSEILKGHGLSFGYRDFLKLGLTTALPALLAALFGLFLVLG